MRSLVPMSRLCCMAVTLLLWYLIRHCST